MFKNMFALSVRQPWAVLVVKGIKPLEIRSWRPPDKHIGKRVLIHAGINKGDAPDEVIRMIARYEIHMGYFIGSAVLAGFREYKEYSRWVIDQKDHLSRMDSYEEGLYGFRFEDSYEFETPIPYPGQLNFFEVNPNDIRLPENQNRTLQF